MPRRNQAMDAMTGHVVTDTSAPSTTSWNLLDMTLEQLCTYYERTERTVDIREETEGEWQAWVDKRVAKAKRNRLARHAVASKRNKQLKQAACTIGGTLHCGPNASTRLANLSPHGTEADDYEWVWDATNRFGDEAHDYDGRFEPIVPVETRSPWQH